MDRNGFGDLASGMLIPTIGGRRAFVPHPLPPVLDLNRLATPLARASQSLGELKGIGRTIANPMLLIRPLQRREAVSSSGMEGTYTTLSDLFLFEAGAGEGGKREDNREVLNYVRALENAIAELSKLPISSRLLKNAHRLLLEGVAKHRGAAVEAGELKRDQNWIGGTGRIETARFIPPPPIQAADALDALCRYVNREERDHAALVDAALAHYQFEAIHPFSDGNGRVGRMMIALMLMEYGALPQPLLYMSPFFERNKGRYIDLMYEVSRKGEWLAWIDFFLEAVSASADSTIAIADKLRTLHSEYRERFQMARRSALLLRIVDLAFERPARLVSDIATELNVTYQGAANNIAELIKQGVAEEIGSYPKVIVFPEILEAIRLD